VVAFPFTDAEWEAIKGAALLVVNASLVEDIPMRASAYAGVLDKLGDLRARYSDHPVLLETQADFADVNAERVELYRRAAAVAEAHGLPTLSIRLSLAGLLLEAGEGWAAGSELLACEEEATKGDDFDQASWADLSARAQTCQPGGSI